MFERFQLLFGEKMYFHHTLVAPPARPAFTQTGVLAEAGTTTVGVAECEAQTICGYHE